MLRTVLTNSLAVIGLLLISSQLFAQSGLSRAIPFSEPAQVEEYTNPVSKIHRLVKESRFYEYLLNHPDFIKIQDIACRVWDNQTGNKRRVSYTNRKVFSIKID